MDKFSETNLRKNFQKKGYFLEILKTF